MFFFTGLLFWARVIDPGPLRPRLEWPFRVAYVVGAMVVGWILAITLVLVPHPLYAHYADLAARPGGISALTDQQIAGGVMWVLGSISFTVAMLVGFYRWLEPESYPPPAPVLAGNGPPTPPGVPDPDDRRTPALTP
jgi:cytochrome c oxidase assembly factor CtaG